MATCPHSMGQVTDDHRGPRRPAVVIAEVTLAAAAGGLGGLAIVAALDPRSHLTSLDSIAMLAGASIGIAVDRLLRT